MKILFRAVIVLLPIGIFAAAMPIVRRLLYHGEVLSGIGLLLAALAVLALVEGLLIRYYLLPQIGEEIGQHVYGGSYVPAEDALVRAVEQAEKSGDVLMLRELAHVVRDQKDRARGWLELARLQKEIAHHPEEAAKTLIEGAAAVSDKEDRALLLYRAAHLYESALNRPNRASELYAEAARRFPRTVYGRKSAEKA